MPRSLLQDMELVRHPETDKAWYAPGPLAFDGVLPNRRKPEDDAETRKMGPEDDRPRRGPVTVYLLNRKDLLDALGPRSQQKTPYLLGRRRGATMVPEVQGAVWRDGLSDMVLGMMRRLAVDALIERATAPGDQTKFIQPVDDWDAVAGVQRRQSILWIRPEGEEEIPHHATYDVPDAKYGAKMAVHDLRRLLGDEELERLRQAAPETFGGPGQLSVLRAWRSHSMMNLHLLLWRLQGYLTPTPRTVKAKKPRQNMSVL